MTKEFQDYLLNYWKYGFEDVCSYCLHYIKCEGKDCPKYENYGNQNFISHSDNSESKKVIWSHNIDCVDTDYGKCPLLKTTKCNNCVENLYSNFLWNGKLPDRYQLV